MPHSSQKRWAFLVGINEYLDHGNYRRLNYCVDDVCELSKVLEQIGYVSTCLHDRSNDWRQPRFPFRSNIISELKRICDAADENDLLLVYFACHGSRDVPDDQKPRLIAVDTHRNALATEGLSIPDDIEPLIMGSKAKQKILMLDACFIGQGRGVHNPAEFVRRVHELAKGYVVMAASTEDQESLESSGLKHSVFCHYVLRGLAGEAEMPGTNAVTVRDLQNFVLDGIREFSVRFSQDQEPQGRSEGNQGDIILADYEQYERPCLNAEAQSNPGVNQGRGGSSPLIKCLWSLDYEDQSTIFKKRTSREYRVSAFIIQAQDSLMQQWLAARLCDERAVNNPKIYPFSVPHLKRRRQQWMDWLWESLGCRLLGNELVDVFLAEMQNAEMQNAVLDELVGLYKTKTVILTIFGWENSQSSNELQNQFLKDFWVPLVNKIEALPKKPPQSRFILLLAEDAAQKECVTHNPGVPSRLAPATIDREHVAEWLDSPSTFPSLNTQFAQDEIAEIIMMVEDETESWNEDPRQAIEKICKLLDRETDFVSFVEEITSRWRLAG